MLSAFVCKYISNNSSIYSPAWYNNLHCIVFPWVLIVTKWCEFDYYPRTNRLLRIYHVFTHFGKTGKLWQHCYLFFLILLIYCLPDLLIILRIIVNPIQYIEGATYLLTENPPVKVISTECSSKYKDIFDLITVAYAISISASCFCHLVS